MGNVENLVRLFLMEKNFSHSLQLAKQTVRAEDSVREDALKNLQWIEENTTSSILTNFHIVMTIISKNLTNDMTATVEMKTKNGYREFEIGDLLIEVNKAYAEIFTIVMDIAKQYSIDIVVRPKNEMTLPDIRA